MRRIISTSFSILFLWLLLSYTAQASKEKVSTCYGTTSKGSLSNGVKLPNKGNNYFSYSNLAIAMGRTYVHSSVKKIIVASFHMLESTQPDKLYKYAETGYQNGGTFDPHKTHQNGLSVDFMTPVADKKGRSRLLPTHALNRYGYDIEFNSNGHYQKLTIDYEAMAAHIVSLDKAAKKQGYGLWRVIFDPKLQAPLFKTQYGPYLKQHIQFTKKRSWVRHDEHYHVDFDIPCQSFN